MERRKPKHPSGGDGSRRPWSRALVGTLSELREEIASLLADPSRDGQLLPLIHAVARQARTDGLRAEEVVLAFHSIWHDVPGVRGAVITRDRVRWTVVSALITAYYDGDAEGSEASG